MPPRRIKKDPKVRHVQKAPRAAPPGTHTPRQGQKPPQRARRRRESATPRVDARARPHVTRAAGRLAL